MMNPLRIFTLPVLLVFASVEAAEIPEPVMLPEITSAGSASVSPDFGVSGKFGSWTVAYAVGEGGMATGGGIRVQLPDAWHSGPRNSANRLQATDPADDHYVSATCSRAGVRLKTIVEHETKSRLVKHAKPSLDGRSERYVFVVRVILTQGRLDPGDRIAVVYGDRSAGSRGYRAAAISTGDLPILLAIDATGDNRFKLHAPSPTIRSVPGKAVEMLFHAPSLAAVGQPIELLISILDQETNPALQGAHVKISALAGRADFPAEIQIPKDRGYVQFTATVRAPGVLRLQAMAEDPGLTAKANPVDVTAEASEQSIYWGDIHSHTRMSWDGVGDRAFEYARTISGLDFYARTDHSRALLGDRTRGLSEKSWAEYIVRADRFNDPGRFVTLHAYECSFGRPYGHHNVYFRDRPGPLLNPTKVTLPELWAALTAGDALTIPHHTGKFPKGIDFSVHDPIFRRNFEIYSGHGLSEAYDPDHPLAFEHSLFTSDSKSLREPTFAQDVWAAGLRLSTVAASDDHRARPGQTHYGLTAVRAPALTRNDVFQALYDRRTYGTTGAKIILAFTLNGVAMGQWAMVNANPALEVRAIGTDRIESVEILRYQPHGERFGVIKTWRPDTLEFTGRLIDESSQPGAIYYVRIKQKNLVRGRIVMAWSSPIWTRPDQ